jgi:RNA-directed DNA polymerase
MTTPAGLALSYPRVFVCATTSSVYKFLGRDTSEALLMGKPAATDRPYLPSLSHSFTLDMVFIIQKDEEPEEMRKQIDQELQKRELKVKESKTRLTNMTEGFNFLGFLFKLIGKPASKSKRFPVKDWLKGTGRKIKGILKRNLSDKIKIGKILRICRGKIQYYKYCDLKSVQGQWWKLGNKIYKRFGVGLPSLIYSSKGYLKIKGNKSPFDGDTVYWVNRMNKKYDGVRRNLIKSQDTKCPKCNLRLRVTDEIHVHHVNKDHSDNRRQNLQILHKACHQIHHRL